MFIVFRYAATILLFVAFATQTFQKTFLVLDYYANTGSFVKNCENRLRPSMHCNGHCVLMKKIKEQETKDQQNQERKESKNDPVSSRSFYASLNIGSAELTENIYPSQKGAITITMPRSIFHPPDKG